ncbi:hypothetical protein [Hymenobacter cellulosilyticus]|uniref:Uncharacterized protein n=1 Tax=Hymenobacter cellulosilyticus TaxID=2932248 RepID=A0A8T9Q2N7_9BACT|nr:hypothetical protein [Hymenobacter cellulosilyticus]UOQ71285.1 hypothetical protein MUN79_21975 [Hymenobacter cellulosilyticus]
MATVYANGNHVTANAAVTADNWAGGLRVKYYPATALSQFRQAAPTTNLAPITTQTATDAYASVLAGAGATLPRRDAVDSRVVQETATGTVSGGSPDGSATYGPNQGIIDSQSAVGGWPVYTAAPRPPTPTTTVCPTPGKRPAA